MGSALILFASKTGETSQMASWISEGLGDLGISADVLNASDIPPGFDPQPYKAYILGSSVYEEDILPELKEVLALMGHTDIRGRTGAAFGAYEWDAEPILRLHEIMRHSLNLDMAAPALALQPPLLGNKEEQAKDLGRRVAESLRKRS